MLEGGLRLGGLGRPELRDDPYVGFRAVHPLFVEDAEQGLYRTSPARRRFFAEETFPAEKRPETFRIACLGGSTVQGRPYSTPTSFPTFLEIALSQADPTRNWEVINCGGISYASYRLVPILDEMLRHQPDLIILCTGHNEFLEDRTYGTLREDSAADEFTDAVNELHTYVLLRDVVWSALGRPTTAHNLPPVLLGPETEPLLDFSRGIEAYHRDEAWADSVAAHFEFNIRRMIERARHAGVPLLLVLPPSNLADTPPFKSQPADSLTADEFEHVRQLRAAASKQYATDRAEAIGLLTEALSIDQQDAGLWYELGRLLMLAGRHSEARVAFVNARDRDVCPLRITSPLAEALEHIARETRTPLLDAHKLLEGFCNSGILDSSLLIDHVHPTFDGHQFIATALVEQLEQAGLITPRPGWRDAAALANRSHLESLPPAYYAQGLVQLEALRGWTRGEADGPDINTRFPQRLRNPRGAGGNSPSASSSTGMPATAGIAGHRDR